VTGILAGVRVLDLTRVASGPWCTQLLADMGASVIKVERPGTGDDSRSFRPSVEGVDGLSAFFLALNRGKQSVTIDISTAEGSALVRELARDCDILVENYKAGTLVKYGLDYASVRDVVPDIIYCSITGFGQTGPSAQRPAYDSILQATAGHMSLCGDPDGEPQRTAVNVADLTTGYCAAVGVLGALIHRMRTGEGQFVDAAMLDVSLALTAQYASGYLTSGEVPLRAGNRAPNTFPSGVFTAGDGTMILVCGNDRQFRALAARIGRPELADDPLFADNRRRRENHEALTEILNDALAAKSIAEWSTLFEAVGVPSAAINDIDQVFADPQVVHRALRVEVEQDDGRLLPVVRSPLNFSRTPAVNGPTPALGAHTDAVLRSLGRDDAEISALRDAGVI
jgi:crotonobetainyl-CoA:carnitine CoA-transferase CaiB-like acyl-CoA transferase